MAERPGPNVFGEVWEREIAHGGFAVRGSRVGAAAGAQRLGVAVYELAPGKRNMPYHAHFGIEELLIVLSGRPTLREAGGERELAAGEVVAFPPGRDSAHQLINNTQEPVRYLMVSSHADADFVEYPDSGKLGARAGAFGTPGAVTHILSTAEQLGYFDGEGGEPQAAPTP
jgi:uncharacterized cupin superfamily protein